MTSYELTLLQKHASSGVLVDTNILLLLIIGSYDKKQIETFKRTRVFAVEDYNTLVNFVSHFSNIITTPNIVTEVSNILGQLPESIRFGVFQRFRELACIVQEQYLPSKDLSSYVEFIRFGVTDTGVLVVGQNHTLS